MHTVVAIWWLSLETIGVTIAQRLFLCLLGHVIGIKIARWLCLHLSITIATAFLKQLVDCLTRYRPRADYVPHTLDLGSSLKSARHGQQTFQHWWIAKQVIPLPFPVPVPSPTLLSTSYFPFLPTCPFPHPLIPFPSALPIPHFPYPFPSLFSLAPCPKSS